jgi:hypothetical protein
VQISERASNRQPRGSATTVPIPPSRCAHAASTAACSAGILSAVRIARLSRVRLARTFQPWVKVFSTASSIVGDPASTPS